MIKKGILLYIAMVIAVFYIIFNSMDYVNSDNSDNSGDYTKWGTDGYFTKSVSESGSLMNSLVDGVFAYPSYIDSKDEFIELLEERYYSGDIKQKIGAAYIVSTMLLGVGDVVNSELSDSDWLSFYQLIDDLSVVWNYNAVNCVNSYYQQNIDNPDIGQYVKCRSEPAILFMNRELDFKYGIFKISGSPLGVFSGMESFVDVDDMLFIDDTCSSLSMDLKVGGYLPGFDVAIGPRYKSLRDMINPGSLSLSSPLTTLRIVKGDCYYY